MKFKTPCACLPRRRCGCLHFPIKFQDKQDIMFASTVLEWYTKGGFDKLIIIDGIVSPEKQLNHGELYGVGSSEKARNDLKNAGIEPIQQGIVAGITGFLLGEKAIGSELT